MFKRKKQGRKLKIEDAILHRLKGDPQKNALDFIAFIHANNLTLERLVDCDGWNVYVKGINSAFLAVDGEKNEFRIVLHISRYDGQPVDDDLREFTWAHVVFCPQGCGSPVFCEESQNRRIILGKEYESTCQSPLAFFNPDAHETKQVQQLLLLLK